MRILDVNDAKDAKVLRKKAKRVQNPQATEIIILTQAMEAICKQPGVAGIAAIQLGVPTQLFALAVNGGPEGSKEKPMFFYNAKIISASDEMVSNPEGCLSIPGKMGTVERSAEVEVKWYDHRLRPYRWVFKGFLAQAIQHEINHQNGTLICDLCEHMLDNAKMEELFNQKKEEEQNGTESTVSAGTNSEG